MRLLAMHTEDAAYTLNVELSTGCIKRWRSHHRAENKPAADAYNDLVVTAYPI